ncbi:MAG: hypothetical protein U0326_32410 [Polyangiales bacterium]
MNTHTTLALCALLSLAACKRTQPEPPRPTPPPPERVEAQPSQPSQPSQAAQPTQAAQPSAPSDAGRPPLVTLRLRNASNVPLTFSTNPDLNEMVHAWRLNVGEDRSDRGLVFLNDPALITRVKLFPVDLPRCDHATGTGFGGLGSVGTFTLAPDETRDLGTWDGLQREEVIDPQQGACLREIEPQPGRFRLQFDQPRQTRHECQRVLLRYPVPVDGGLPVLEFRCVPRPDGAVDNEE